MNDPLFELLSNADLVKNDQLNIDKVRKLSIKQIIDLSHQSAALTSIRDIPKERSIFVHSASRSLTGDRWPCREVSCRLRRATNLAQFAALYSECVYFRNYLADYSIHPEMVQKEKVGELRSRFADDLSVLLYLRPLIEQGAVVPVTPPRFCVHCLATQSFGPDEDGRFKTTFRDLAQRYLDETTVTYRYRDGLYRFIIRGPDLLIDHGAMAIVSPEPHKLIAAMPRLMKDISAGKEMPLSQSLVKRIGLARRLAAGVEAGISFELATSHSIGTMFLTDREIDIEVLGQLSGNPELKQRNLMFQKHLTCIVPFIDAISPTDLMRLRNREEDSFILFRSALTKAIYEYKGNETELTERSAKQIYGDILQPQLAKLDSKVSSARRTLLKKTTAQLATWTAAISIGLYLGFLPSGIAAAAAALGLTKVLADMGQEFLIKRDVEEEVRQEEMYFLWKVKQLSRQ